MSNRSIEGLRHIIAAQKNGRPMGIISVCSANPFVLEAAMRQAKADGTDLCIESSGVQVNQFGGTSGMTPKDFVSFVERTAEAVNFPRERIIPGGDCLGPGPWRAEPVETALKNAHDLVREYVLAGYQKIHLDAGMPLKGDAGPIGVTLAAERAADLFQTAESAAASLSRDLPGYVIGTELFSGESEEETLRKIPKPDDLACLMASTQESLERRGLASVWDRTVALGVQPVADFGPETVSEYSRQASEELVAFMRRSETLVFEARATDHQTQTALSEMVEDQFAILKVGPGLTFAFREALTALVHVEEELLTGRRGVILSKLREVIDDTMSKDPAHWKKNLRGDESYRRYARYYSFNDRVRNYWPRHQIQQSIQRLFANLQTSGIPLPLISQYLPKQYDAVREKRLSAEPRALICDKIMEVTARFAAACRSRSAG